MKTKLSWSRFSEDEISGWKATFNDNIIKITDGFPTIYVGDVIFYNINKAIEFINSR